MGQFTFSELLTRNKVHFTCSRWRREVTDPYLFAVFIQTLTMLPHTTLQRCTLCTCRSTWEVEVQWFLGHPVYYECLIRFCEQITRKLNIPRGKTFRIVECLLFYAFHFHSLPNDCKFIPPSRSVWTVDVDMLALSTDLCSPILISKLWHLGS
jgi:hypothetical protein